jgi:hypothetical protein
MAETAFSKSHPERPDDGKRCLSFCSLLSAIISVILGDASCAMVELQPEFFSIRGLGGVVMAVMRARFCG